MPSTKISIASGSERLLIGWREWLALPQLNIPALKAKIDTGARSSALHVANLQTFTERGARHAQFLMHPIRRKPQIEIRCQSEVIDERWVSDSGGHREKRLVIWTPVQLGEQTWSIELTLTNRENMLFRMLLGRTAMEGQLVVDPAQSYCCGRALRRVYRRRAKQVEQN